MFKFKRPLFFILILLFIACNKEKSENNVVDINNSVEEFILHYSFDSQNGTIVLNTPSNQYQGILHGGQWSIEDNKTTIELKGDDYIEIPNDATSTFNDLEYGSISVTFKFRNFNGKIQPLVYFGESSSGTPHNSLIIEIGHGGNLDNKKLYFTIINARFCFDSNVNLIENTWYHFVAVVSPEKNTGYLNGVELSNRNYNLGSNANYTDFFSAVPIKEQFTLGYGRYGLSDDFYFFDGFISDFRVYKDVLTQKEVVELFNKFLF